MMKAKILKYLRQAGEEFVSGQALCERLGVSRQAVWKNITQLKEAGFGIESVSNKGYHLVKTPDMLYGPDIESMLLEQGCCKKVECHQQIDSTNTRAKQLAELGEPEGTLVVADEQTAGKGRRGRSFLSELGGGTYFTLLLRPDVRPQEVSCITLLAAMAVAKGVRMVTEMEPQIKWPNDVILSGKKMCGILTETSSEMDYIHYVVVGIGVNANTKTFPEELRDKATSLYMESGEKVDRDWLTAAIVNSFSFYYEKYLQTKDLSRLLEEYDSMLVNKDREVQILFGMAEQADPDKIQQGIARGINADGALLVETEEGIVPVVSGEVSVRGVYGYI